MWDERYSAPGYLFGTEPAAFVRRHAPTLPPASRVLSLADGEGRNSIYLARLGHSVTAMDASAVALEKVRPLAAKAGVEVDFHHADIHDWQWAPDALDAVLGVFFQFLIPAQRSAVFAGIARTLRPGGLLLLHGYAPRQLQFGTGGPDRVENLYTLDLLRAEFAGFQVLEATDYDAEIHEGERHNGMSALIDFVARKPG